MGHSCAVEQHQMISSGQVAARTCNSFADSMDLDCWSSFCLCCLPISRQSSRSCESSLLLSTYASSPHHQVLYCQPVPSCLFFRTVVCCFDAPSPAGVHVGCKVLFWCVVLNRSLSVLYYTTPSGTIHTRQRLTWQRHVALPSYPQKPGHNVSWKRGFML